MNEGIADADAVLILHSKHTPTATMAKLEMHAALWNEVYGNLDPTAPEASQNLLEGLCKTLLPDRRGSKAAPRAIGRF
jgi:hypothetical protein